MKKIGKYRKDCTRRVTLYVVKRASFCVTIQKERREDGRAEALFEVIII